MDKEPPEPENPIGVIVIGNLEGDRVHQNSKDMVRKSLKKAQFKTIDIGKNVSAEMFASKAKEYNADIIAVSINTSMAKDNLNKLLPAIEAAGLKDKVTVYTSIWEYDLIRYSFHNIEINSFIAICS